MMLEGSCRCGHIGFTLTSNTPYPYQRCYCGICRKTAGGGGYAINIMGNADTLKITGENHIGEWHAQIGSETSPAARTFCTRCASSLWLFDPRWPNWVYPLASVIDTELPAPPELVHLMLRYKPGWVKFAPGPKDQCFDEYPEESIEEWHKRR
ncbi:MAG: GFA family protein, partial [Candidatus Binataceae bacterium]